VTRDEFHNGMRILMNIDKYEFVDALKGARREPWDMPDRHWPRFRTEPWVWFIQASDADADAVWAIVEKRMNRNAA